MRHCLLFKFGIFIIVILILPSSVHCNTEGGNEIIKKSDIAVDSYSSSKDKKEIFSFNDKKVTWWAKATKHKPYHMQNPNLIAYWYSPIGEIYRKDEFGGDCPTQDVLKISLPIKDNLESKDEGLWKIEVYHEGTLIDERFFKISDKEKSLTEEEKKVFDANLKKATYLYNKIFAKVPVAKERDMILKSGVNEKSYITRSKSIKEFYNFDDEKVVWWLKPKPYKFTFHQSPNITSLWFSPDGNLYRAIDYNVPFFNNTMVATISLKVKDEIPKNLAGIWKVEVYFEDGLLDEKFFWIGPERKKYFELKEIEETAKRIEAKRAQDKIIMAKVHNKIPSGKTKKSLDLNKVETGTDMDFVLKELGAPDKTVIAQNGVEIWMYFREGAWSESSRMVRVQDYTQRIRSSDTNLGGAIAGVVAASVVETAFHTPEGVLIKIYFLNGVIEETTFVNNIKLTDVR